MRPRISIILPVYNRMHLIRHSMQSLFDQTFKDFEIIAVDDGSDDSTWEILKELQAKDSRVKPQKLKRHSGLTEAIKLAHEVAEGDICVKQDSDDLSLPNRLEVIERMFSKYPAMDFFYHSMYQTFTEDSDLLRRDYIRATQIEKERILKEQYIPGAYSYKRESVLKLPYRKLHCSEDWMLILDFFLRDMKIGYIDEALYEYIMRPDSNSVMSSELQYREDEESMKTILSEEYGIHNFTYGQGKIHS